MIKATKNIIENASKALPKPPKNVTRVPTKNTAVAVKKRPILKQKPVAVALIMVGNNSGM